MQGWHKGVEERVELFKSFLRRDNTRPLLGFFRGSEYPLFRYPFSNSLPEKSPLRPEDFNVKAFVDDCETLFIGHEECGGDFIFSASAFWGIPWLEAALGCPIFADHLTGSIYSEPPPDFKPNALPEFSTSNPWMLLMAEMLEALSKKSAGRFPLATTRMRGVSDLLSALYGGDGFVFAMIEKPDEIKRVSGQLTDFFIQCGKMQLSLIPDFHGGTGSFYYHIWMPKGSVWHQEDATALLSPALYEEFIEPCDRRIVKSFDHVVMHQHSTGFVPTEKYIDMGMSVLELHIDTGGPSAEALYERHLAILKRKPLLIWGDIPEKDLDWLFTRLPAKGLALITVVKNPEQAEKHWRKYVGE
ncbi:MAG: hypothetical protein NT118_09680 [Lentisphaerae bacterium]|nr:hypothetical protein [Lentisphaerota bacterium]